MKLFASLDLGFAERILSRAYRPEGSVGRPHRNLRGMFKAELVKRLRGIESYRELYRLLQVDEVLSNLCEIKTGEKPYDRMTMTRFRRRGGSERFQRVMNHLVKQLIRMGMRASFLLNYLLHVNFVKWIDERILCGRPCLMADNAFASRAMMQRSTCDRTFLRPRVRS